MTTEQKKAIKSLDEFVNTKYGAFSVNEGRQILNLIQEQDNEINKYLEIITNKVIETAKDDLLTEKNIELEKKDKIIDELAKAFKQDDVRSIKEIKEYFKELAKEKGE